MYKHQQFVGKGVKQLRAEKEAILDQVCVCVCVCVCVVVVVLEIGVRWASLARLN